MDFNETGVVCTKRRIWKKPTLVLQIIDALLEEGLTFKDLVIGEPNNFIFADHYDEIRDLFKRKGFYGIRIKMQLEDGQLEINSNTDGIDNVQYTIFASTDEQYEKLENCVGIVQELITPSSESIEKATEYIGKHRKIRNAVILVLILVIIYVLGVHVFLLDIFSSLLSFSPALLIYIGYLYLRRRR